jgi:hypothetical protein
MLNEQVLNELKIDHNPILDPLIDNLLEQDSENFCSSVIGDTKSSGIQ